MLDRLASAASYKRHTLHVSTSRNTLMTHLLESKQDIVLLIRAQREEISNLLTLLTQSQNFCKTDKKAVTCGQSNIVHSDTKDNGIFFTSLVSKYRPLKTNVFKCLFKQNKQIYYYNEFLHLKNGSEYLVDNHRIPQSCTTTLLDNVYECSALYTATPQNTPKYESGIFFIPFSDQGSYFQTFEDNLKLVVADQTHDITRKPKYISHHNMTMFVKFKNDSLKRFQGDLSMSAATSFHFTLLSHKETIEPSYSGESENSFEFPPILKKTIDQIGDFLSSITGLHNESGIFRGILWSSVASACLILSCCVCSSILLCRRAGIDICGLCRGCCPGCCGERLHRDQQVHHVFRGGQAGGQPDQGQDQQENGPFIPQAPVWQPGR